jgi:arylsulfatase A-like enzyme
MTPIDTVEYAVYAKPLPELLRENGYFTIHAGKAHLGAISTPASDPLNLGFDVNIAGHAAGAPASYLGSEAFGNNNPDRSVWAVPGLKKYHGEEIFLSEALTREAISELKSNQGKPFFLYMSHYAVHTPIMADNRYFKDYLEMGLDTIEARYASMVQGMDKSLGDLMDYLDESGNAENTVILFMSDNGGLSAHARGGEPHVHNAPLNSGKGSAYEGGIREPMLVKWPGVTEAGAVSEDRVIIEDFFTTILEIADVNYEVPQVVDGISFVPLLKGEEGNDERSMYWHYPNRWGGVGPGIGPSSTIRKGEWKLIYFHKSRHFELYNITNDIGETRNLAETSPEVLQSLAKDLGMYLRSVDAQMPYDKLTKEQVPFPDEVL